MNETLLRQWWWLALRGAIAILFGVLAIAWPAVTLLSLAALFAAFALVGGAVWTFGAIRHRKTDDQWWVMLVLGLVSILAGAAAMLYPAMTMLVLVLLFGANALVTGVMDLIIAVRVRRYIRGEWLLLLSGVVGIVFGLIVLLFPLEAGVVALSLVLGIYALVSGAMLLALSIRVRKWARINAGRSSPAAGAV